MEATAAAEAAFGVLVVRKHSALASVDRGLAYNEEGSVDLTSAFAAAAAELG